MAIDSVAYDFLLAEWPQVVKDGVGGTDSLEDGAQDYLHEAALAGDPPSETFYDPENDGVSMGSLGVHEHWNNSDDKQYSRNLGSGEGIELISSEPSMFICEGDFDEDGDIDGSDLAELSNAINLLDIGAFVSNFAKVECTIGNTEISADPVQ